MDRSAAAGLLEESYVSFAELIQNLDHEQLSTAPKNKWSALQQLDHLIKSVKPVNQAFTLPAFVLKWRFGKANRDSRTYDELVERYRTKLLTAGEAPRLFAPPTSIPPTDRHGMLKELSSHVRGISRKTKNKNEATLDQYILPHPLLGMITLREMVYFSAYHAQHHAAHIRKMLELE